MGAFEELPEGCIAAILSHTTPVDAGRLSVVSKTFGSAADSDDVWNRFLNYDSQFINFINSHSPPSIANAPTKKALYLALSSSTMVKRAFNWIERVEKGVMCFLLDLLSFFGVMMVNIGSGLLCLIPVAKFLKRWFKVYWTIDTGTLSPNTQYVAYLVFKTIAAFGFENHLENLLFCVKEGHRSTKFVYLEEWQRPSVRRNGWLEIEMGEFFNLCLEDEEVHLSYFYTYGDFLKGNFYLEGIEVRPKEEN